MRIVVEQVDTSTDSAGYNSTSSSGREGDNADSPVENVAEMGITRLLMRINPYLAAFAVGLETTVEAIDKMKTSALDFAMKIEQYAPQVQVANAQRDLTMMQASMKADSIAGKDLGDLIKANAKSDAYMVEIDARINKYEARIATWFETQLRQPFLEFFSVVLRDIDNLIEGKDTEALRAAANNIGAFQQILLPIPNVPNLPPDNRNPQPFGMPLGV